MLGCFIEVVIVFIQATQRELNVRILRRGFLQVRIRLNRFVRVPCNSRIRGCDEVALGDRQVLTAGSRPAENSFPPPCRSPGSNTPGRVLQ